MFSDLLVVVQWYCYFLFSGCLFVASYFVVQYIMACIMWVTLVHISEVNEQLWLQMHTDNGPYLLCVWYRPPVQREVQSITSFETELDELRCDSIGIMLLGDLNLHSTRWLVHSSSNTSEAGLMRNICRRKGLHQIVRQPTRGQYLLDLAFTDIESASVVVMPKIADHAILVARLNLTIPRTASHKRTGDDLTQVCKKQTCSLHVIATLRQLQRGCQS